MKTLRTGAIGKQHTINKGIERRVTFTYLFWYFSNKFTDMCFMLPSHDSMNNENLWFQERMLGTSVN